MFSSESVALDCLGYDSNVERDLDPGEAVFIDKNGKSFLKNTQKLKKCTLVFLNMFI